MFLIDELQGCSVAGTGGTEVSRVRGHLAVALLGLLLQSREPHQAVVQAGLVEGSCRDLAASRDGAGAPAECSVGLLGGVRHSADILIILSSNYNIELLQADSMFGNCEMFHFIIKL